MNKQTTNYTNNSATIIHLVLDDILKDRLQSEIKQCERSNRMIKLIDSKGIRIKTNKMFPQTFQEVRSHIFGFDNQKNRQAQQNNIKKIKNERTYRISRRSCENIGLTQNIETTYRQKNDQIFRKQQRNFQWLDNFKEKIKTSRFSYSDIHQSESSNRLNNIKTKTRNLKNYVNISSNRTITNEKGVNFTQQTLKRQGQLKKLYPQPKIEDQYERQAYLKKRKVQKQLQKANLYELSAVLAKIQDLNKKKSKTKVVEPSDKLTTDYYGNILVIEETNKLKAYQQSKKLQKQKQKGYSKTAANSPKKMSLYKSKKEISNKYLKALNLINPKRQIQKKNNNVKEINQYENNNQSNNWTKVKFKIKKENVIQPRNSTSSIRFESYESHRKKTRQSDEGMIENDNVNQQQQSTENHIKSTQWTILSLKDQNLKIDRKKNQSKSIKRKSIEHFRSNLIQNQNQPIQSQLPNVVQLQKSLKLSTGVFLKSIL